VKKKAPKAEAKEDPDEAKNPKQRRRRK